MAPTWFFPVTVVLLCCWHAGARLLYLALGKPLPPLRDVAGWQGVGLQLFGVGLLALNIDASPFAYIWMLLGAAIGFFVAVAERDLQNAALMAGFEFFNVIGAIRWLA
ncbi:MAG TPA: hypothetical protein VIM56_03825 [Rhizomicrobium sp.]